MQVISENVRRFRVERGFSLGEVASRSGLSKQTLSKLESADSNPTVETLAAVSATLGVPFRRLVTEWGHPIFLRRAADSSWTRRSGVDVRALDEVFGTGQVRTEVVRLTKDRRALELPAHHLGTLIHLYVIDGRLRTGTVADPVDLEAGDFVRFAGDVPHRHEALSDTALAHVVLTIPQARRYDSPGVEVATG